MRRTLEVVRTAKKYDRATGEFRVDIRYRSRAMLTERTAAVAEAFGLGLDGEREHVVYDDLRLKMGPGDVVYISGESGSGKSVFLRALERDLGGEAANIDGVEVDPDRPVIDTVGGTFRDGLRLLSAVGLNDAYLLLRRYPEFSDGQRYRYRLARLMERPERFWLADEFCSTLDRTTARVVAFNVQKQARRLGRCLIAATCHTDLGEDLAPSVHVRKGFGSRLEVDYTPDASASACSVAREVTIEPGTPADYRSLAEFHYRSGRLPPPVAIFAMRRGRELVGVVVYSYPGINCFGRSLAMGRRVPVEELNREWAVISRVILRPRYRSMGLGHRLVRETLPRVERRYVEAVAVMALYNPFFERAGMEKITETAPDDSIVEAVEGLRRLGFNPVTLASESANFDRLKRMTVGEMEAVREVLLSISSGYYKRLVSSRHPYVKKREFLSRLQEASHEQVARMLKTVAVLNQVKAYLFWRAPEGEG